MRSDKLLVAALVMSLGTLRVHADQTFESTRCGVTFSYPSSWTIDSRPRDAYTWELSEEETQCIIGISPPSWKREMRTSAFNLESYAVEVVVAKIHFLALTRQVGFRRIRDYDGDLPLNLEGLGPDEWTIDVRQGEAPAKQFATSCCQVVRGSSWGHGVAKDGSTATITSDIAVLNDRHGRSVIISSQDDDRFQSVVGQIVKSFRFTNATAP